jgi:hypothetical protein
MEDDASVSVRGEELSCPEAGPDNSYTGCPQIGFDAMLNDDEASLSLVFAEDGRLWVRFSGYEYGEHHTDYEPIGERVE